MVGWEGTIKEEQYSKKIISFQEWEILSLGQKEEAVCRMRWRGGKEGEVDGGMCNSNKLEITEKEEEIRNNKAV